MKTPENQFLVIFGASGDLTTRKLIPALYDLFRQNLLPEKFAILGASRSNLSDADFRQQAETFLPSEKEVVNFKKLLFYEQISPSSSEDFKKLKLRLETMGKELGIKPN